MESRWYAVAARPQRRRGPVALLGVVLLALVVASCDIDLEPEPDPEVIDRVGVVVLTQVAPDSAPLGQAAFLPLTSPRDAMLLASPFGAEVGTCLVSPHLDASSAAPTTTPKPARLNAGDIALNVGGSYFGAMSPVESGAYVLAGASGPLPSEGLSLSLSATGAFPAFPELTLDPGPAPALDPSVDVADVHVGSEFTWSPGRAGSAMLLIGFGDGVGFSCLTEDSRGAFTFPEETRAELTAAGFTAGRLNTIGRFSTAQATNGSAHLLFGTIQLATVGDER